MTREEIEQLNVTEPYCCETDREEQWYQVGLIEGLRIADQHPKRGLWDAKKVIEWLMNNINNYLVKGRDIDLIYEDLRKVMED